MEITELLERIVAQNETIIRQNVELLIVLGVMVEKDSKTATKPEQDLTIGRSATSDEAA